MAKKKRTTTRSRGGRSRKARPETAELIVVPVRNMVLFPGVVLPLMIGREHSVEAVRAAFGGNQPVGLLLQRDEAIEAPGPDDLYEVGTLTTLVRYWTAPDGRHQAICQGDGRFRIVEFVQTEPFMVARVELIQEDEPEGRAIDARFMALKQRAEEVLGMAPGAPEEMAQAVRAIESPAMLADMVSTFLDVPAGDKQELLELVDLRKRLDRLNHLLGDWAEVLRLSQKIRNDTKGHLEKAQREYYLREQLRIIRRELGEEDDEQAELGEFAERLEALELPEAVEREARRDLRRLERMPEQAAEYSMLRTWFEVFLELPWNEATEDRLDLDHASEILEEDHHGLQKVKDRILEFLAVRKLNPGGQGPTLCLVGPPGVGKTSLGKSIARAMGREFVRVSLGGVHDEAEVRGHRRTYVGAMLGRILDGLRRAKTRNPVFILDEMDKLGAGLHGDPSAAMLEVLDPAQNSTFTDNYLGVPFDLSDVLFVATANVLDQIPLALRDRLEVIHIPGYTEEEKVAIARRFLLPRQLKAAGLTRKKVKVSSAALKEVVRFYTREAGVRNLEREVGAICRHGATLFARRRRKPLEVDPEEVQEILGPRRFESDVAQRTSRPGVATGLAWTPVGGEILFIEATSMPGKGELILTGQLGDVMRESARAALTLVKARSADLGIDHAVFDCSDLHVHLPAGAVPKDGPIAGITMVTALVSLLTGKKVRGHLAMTGEISLRGLVLPVGGIKEKILAARAAGIRTVIMPERNRPDYESISEEVGSRPAIVYVSTIEQVLEVALGG